MRATRRIYLERHDTKAFIRDKTRKLHFPVLTDVTTCSTRSVPRKDLQGCWRRCSRRTNYRNCRL